jgi:hypothetical protein
VGRQVERTAALLAQTNNQLLHWEK